MAEVRSDDEGEFEPPKYLTSLIAAINDGAKLAQSGALVFALVGIYLLATAFSATDEDLLRGRAVTISQIGASLPPAVSFAIAPLVFVFLHIYTLARYHMLAANVRQFLGEIQISVASETDRERCRQLLANVEFVQALIAPRDSPLYSFMWRLLVYMVIAVFPILVLLLVQINALRYQSYHILWVQQSGLVIDLSALVWFFSCNSLKKPKPLIATRMRLRHLADPLRPASHCSGGISTETSPGTRAGPFVWILTRSMRSLGLLWLPVVIFGVNVAYFGIVRPDKDVQKVHYVQTRVVRGETWTQYLVDAFYEYNPLDVLSCPQLRWGCRYLRLDHLTLVDHVLDERAIEELGGWGRPRTSNSLENSGGPVNNSNQVPNKNKPNPLTENSNALTAIQGLVLRDRLLRFVSLEESLFYNADLTNADLSGAQLRSAQLSGARLEDAILTNANLQDANLEATQLRGVELKKTNLQDADLVGAQLQGADLKNRPLLAARLSEAILTGADLRETQLQGADLRLAQLQVSDLRGAQLWGTDLRGAQLQDADLRGAKLLGTKFGPAEVQCHDDKPPICPPKTNLEFSDLRNIDFGPLTDPEKSKFKNVIDKGI